MSRDVLTVGFTMRIPLLYRGEYSQWVERFMNYLEEQTDGEAGINSIKNDDQPLPRVTQVSIAGTSSTEQPALKDKSKWSDQEKKIQKIDQWKQYATMIRHNKNLIDINIDALYNILKQNQGDVNDVTGLKKKTIMVTSDPLALNSEKTKVSKRKEKVVVSLDSKGSDADDFSELKKITDFYFEKAKDLRPSLYDEKVIGLGHTLMFLTHSDEALEIEKFKRAKENKSEFSYDYASLNASYVNEKVNFLDDYFQEIINPDFDKIDSLIQQTSSLKPYVPTVILEKIIIDLEDEVVSLLEKEKTNLETFESLKSKGFESSEKVDSETENQSENDCEVVEKECDNMEN
nr:hypothetical protein [Tanacetum cinerariifolium]